MLILLAIHVVATVVAPLVVRWLGARGFWVLAVPSLLTVGWALANSSATRTPQIRTWEWIPGLSLNIDLRLDALGWVLTLIVAGIGALVLFYCAGYFSDDEPDLQRFAAHLTGFAGVMLGLVWSDNLLLLYLFWELTTVLSYLLVGHLNHKKESRNAATQALVVTTFGGLAMLVGMIILGQVTGTYRISEIVAHPPADSLLVASAIGLLLLGAVSKAAQVPFHFWLPGAMAAPTPVSAYLHAAAMVKAGVYLVARFAPGFSSTASWLPIVLGVGGLTMLVGGYRALRQHDLKLLLAYGTVSQLGFLILLVGAGTPEAALAGITMVCTHALFKAGLFLTVGAIDHATGTRDLRVLHRLGRRMPVLMVASTICAASMAGVPPMFGFVGKEAAYTALFHGADRWSLPMLIVVVVGSVLTFAYSARFVVGAWGPATDPACADGKETRPHPNKLSATVPPVVLALATLVAGPLSPMLEPFFTPWSSGFGPAAEHPVHLGLWHGVNGPLLLSVLTLALGLVLFWRRRGIEKIQQGMGHPPSAVSGYRKVMHALDRVSLEVTGLVYRGSLPLSLTLILGTFLVLPGGATLFALIGSDRLANVRWWDTPAQAAVAVVVAVAAIWAARSRRRLRGVFLVGITGYGLALLFLLHGAPDLALTQVLVETVSMVVFVLVLRRFSGRFRDQYTRANRAWRVVVGVLSGAVITGAAVAASLVRNFPTDSAEMARSAAEFGGGYNVVNVILVDIRAWDTMGEISVVLVAATGVASLIFLSGDRMTLLRKRLADMRSRRHQHHRPVDDDSVGWLAEVTSTPPETRSLLFEVVTRLIFQTIMVWSLYLLFTGHNDPGGGFAAGLVAGLALTVRYLAGGAQELRAAMPVMPGILLGTGLFLSAGVGFISMLAGGEVLRSWTFDIPVPVIGKIHLVTSMFFDIGVYLVVIGLMLDVLRSLGSTLDREIAEAEGSDNDPRWTLTGTPNTGGDQPGFDQPGRGESR